jgi:hypothetical protein
MRINRIAVQALVALSTTLFFPFASQTWAADHRLEPKLLDEVRIGLSGSIQSSRSHESGVFPSLTVFFDPLDRAAAADWKEIMLRPRIHAGAIVSTTGNASQLYTGFTWTVDVSERLFVDLGLGAALNNAELGRDGGGSNGPEVGCHVLFHESLAAGYKLTKNWRLLATVQHSSNANFCDSNGGLSYAGLSVGYKF